MDLLKKLVIQVAHSPIIHQSHNLSLPHLSLIPLLSAASSLYRFSLLLRQLLYRYGFFTHQNRLAVPVISVGNLTWGGNGKTPMVELIARFLAQDLGISPLILTRGYSGGDEVRMLQRHFAGTCVKIGVGANRFAVASEFLEKYGYVKPADTSSSNNQKICFRKKDSYLHDKMIGAVVLDDGMQEAFGNDEGS